MNEPTPTDTPAPEVSELCAHLRVIYDIPKDGYIERTITKLISESLAKATPAPSLTGEDVSDEARAAADYYRTHAEHTGPLLLERVMQDLLSTARAQDKALINSLTNANIVATESAHAADVLAVALNSEASRLRAEVIRIRSSYHEQEKEVARLKAEVKSETARADQNLRVWETLSEVHDRTTTTVEELRHENAVVLAQNEALALSNCGYRARLAQAQSERDKYEERCIHLRAEKAQFDRFVVALNQTIDEIAVASGCPGEQFIRDWVGQLAEDKRRLLTVYEEATSSTSVSHEYDATPTAEERLQRIAAISKPKV